MAAEPSLEPLAAVLAAEISTPSLSDWKAARANLGLSNAGALGIGLDIAGGSPYVPQPGDEEALDESLELLPEVPTDA